MDWRRNRSATLVKASGRMWFGPAGSRRRLTHVAASTAIAPGNRSTKAYPERTTQTPRNPTARVTAERRGIAAEKSLPPVTADAPLPPEALLRWRKRPTGRPRDAQTRLRKELAERPRSAARRRA